MHEELEFTAMGSDAHVIVIGRAGLAGIARERIAVLEARWSRFLATSEVSALNRAAGTRVEVSHDSVRLVELAIEGWRLSGGGFDPLMLADVERAGYDRSFAEMFPRVGGSGVVPVRAVSSASSTSLRSSSSSSDLGSPLTRPYASRIEIDAAGVRLPPACGFDPGGIGKGLAADIVAGELLADGADGVCINLGGDLRVGGGAPAGGDWAIAIEDPWSHDPIVHVGVRAGAVATSSTARRRWIVGDEARHHLIDPATGQPSTTDLVSVTVIAAAAWSAEVLAKAALLRGSQRWHDILPAGVEGLAVDDNGGVHTSDRFDTFTAREPVVAGAP